MWIHCSNPATVRLHDSECMPADYTVTFSNNGFAQVTADVGAALVETYDTITEHTPEE